VLAPRCKWEQCTGCCCRSCLSHNRCCLCKPHVPRACLADGRWASAGCHGSPNPFGLRRRPEGCSRAGTRVLAPRCMWEQYTGCPLQIMLEPQSLLLEQPHVPVLAWQTGVGLEQVFTVSQPVSVALHFWRILPGKHWYCPALQVAATHWLLLQTLARATNRRYWSNPQIPVVGMHTGVLPVQGVGALQPVRVLLQTCDPVKSAVHCV
jgi:hypothetical protein